MSFGAFGGRRDVMSFYDPAHPKALPHGGTFNNNVLTMAAGVAGLSRVFTPEVAEALYRRGEDLRARLNAISPRMQWTGMGSLMCAHFTAGPIHSPADTARTPQALRDLFHFDLLERGFYLARRGMIALSLEVGEEELDRLVEAVGEIVATRGPVIDGATMGA
jgi:glutamate-1-semialdehyde 2,1-aminomutase